MIHNPFVKYLHDLAKSASNGSSQKKNCRVLDILTKYVQLQIHVLFFYCKFYLVTHSFNKIQWYTHMLREDSFVELECGFNKINDFCSRVIIVIVITVIVCVVICVSCSLCICALVISCFVSLP